MAELVLRTVKNAPVENIELDTNFVNLAKDTQISVRNSISWAANLPVTYSQILNIQDRFYFVSTAGTTGTVAPTHTSGSSLNGTSMLLFTIPSTYTASDVLTKIKLVDGVGSGLDADLLQGLPVNTTVPTPTDKSSIPRRDANGDIFARRFVGGVTLADNSSLLTNLAPSAPLPGTTDKSSIVRRDANGDSSFRNVNAVNVNATLFTGTANNANTVGNQSPEQILQTALDSAIAISIALS